ncbi:MAG: hypothetical protein QNI87_03265 [Erythrobacter sp.]|uniref:hypothetical protein n=1 Tax=Erythrobacter sp. TaxID=1042 RepID=UPI002623ECDB|nr:hypothetical protein [Erythrobacter sp.]MDJ0977531.1 hypothetical protein [Erythrobacter sp.]
MRAQLCLPFAALALGGCSLLFPEDPRVGDEDEGVCQGRVRTSLTYQQSEELRTSSGLWVPTFTYDVTKLDLAAIKALTVPGTDDTAGTRLMQETNRTSTAVERFMQMEVDQKGAFFLGRDPSLYRVRGQAQPSTQILKSGCARQQENMRLIAVSWERYQLRPKAIPDPEETDSGASADND